jgi:hypothetical protein
MGGRPTVLERAFELAGQGIPTRYLRTMLLREGYEITQLHGGAIRAQLIKLAEKARKGAESSAER